MGLFNLFRKKEEKEEKEEPTVSVSSLRLPCQKCQTVLATSEFAGALFCQPCFVEFRDDLAYRLSHGGKRRPKKTEPNYVDTSGGFTKIVINDCFGGFGISEKAVSRLKELGLDDASRFYFDDYMLRSDPMLVRVVEELGSEASGEHAKLMIKEIPYQIDWDIDDYDGVETVVEKGRSW